MLWRAALLSVCVSLCDLAGVKKASGHIIILFRLWSPTVCRWNPEALWMKGSGRVEGWGTRDKHSTQGITPPARLVNASLFSPLFSPSVLQWGPGKETNKTQIPTRDVFWGNPHLGWRDKPCGNIVTVVGRGLGIIPGALWSSSCTRFDRSNQKQIKERRCQAVKEDDQQEVKAQSCPFTGQRNEWSRNKRTYSCQQIFPRGTQVHKLYLQYIYTISGSPFQIKNIYSAMAVMCLAHLSIYHIYLFSIFICL